MKWYNKGLALAISILCFFTLLPVNAQEKNNDLSGVNTVDFSSFTKEISDDPLISTVGEILLNANKFALNNWWNEVRDFD